VFKKLDKLIIRAFIGPFIATFFITLLVLVMQFFWLYIDDFVGKGLGTGVILEFIWFQSAALVPLALPLAILLSSLMTFGNLGESFELVAIKSSGISLLRFMRPLFIITIFICGIAFLFSNFIIPVANLKSKTLLGDIVLSKPAFDLKEGVFYDRINGFSIKIGKKEANDSIIRDVIVYEQGNPLQDNFIIAKSGIMRVSADKRYLEFNLRDGWRYQEKGDNRGGPRTDYVRMGFKEYTKQFDLSTLGFDKRTPDSVNKNNARVLSLRQLDMAIDSLQKENNVVKEQLSTGIFAGYDFVKYIDSNWTSKNKPDTALKKVKSFSELLPDSAKRLVTQRVQSQVSSIRLSQESITANAKDKGLTLRKHQIEWHRKISLSMACLVLFLIGAPLGSIIRKGGLGTPLIIAIGFFMLFFFSNTSGEKMVKGDKLTPFVGMWLASFILLPVGVFLTYKAMHDSQLFNKEAYSRAARFVRGFFSKRKKDSAV
jgi:lipopolysaccharide export system permease protein